MVSVIKQEVGKKYRINVIFEKIPKKGILDKNEGLFGTYVLKPSGSMIHSNSDRPQPSLTFFLSWFIR